MMKNYKNILLKTKKSAHLLVFIKKVKIYKKNCAFTKKRLKRYAKKIKMV